MADQDMRADHRHGGRRANVRTSLARIGIGLMLALPASMGLAADKPSASQFVNGAAASGMFEIESSKVALRKSNSTEVKQFAQQMIQDHGKASARLKDAASSANVTPVPDKMDAKHQTMFDQLNGAPEAAFDGMYGKMQVAGHEEAIALFTSYSSQGDNPALKSFASDTLPTLKAHLEHAKKLPQK